MRAAIAAALGVPAEQVRMRDYAEWALPQDRSEAQGRRHGD